MDAAEREAALDEAERKLNEALSGYSGKSKNSLIKEALKAIRQAK
jgi:hypothetical protein